MAKDKKKPKWGKPKLIVLVRGTKQEMVLTSCKTTSGRTGTLSSYQSCNGKAVAPASCTVCSATAST